MTRITGFLSDIIRKPPILFPLVGLFHIIWLLFAVWNVLDEPFGNAVWVELGWMLGYSICWIAACDLRKWGALGYIVLTLLNAGVYLAVMNGMADRGYLSNLFLLDGLFSFFLLFYYKRLR